LSIRIRNPAARGHAGQLAAGALLGLALVPQCPAQTPQTAATSQFEKLRTHLRDSHKQNDWQGNLGYARQQLALLNGAPRALLEVARAELNLGDTESGLQLLEQFARMGQAMDLAPLAPDAAALAANPRFQQVQRAMEANRAAVALGTTLFVLGDAPLLAEDVDYDARQQRFYISAVRAHKIISTDRHGVSADFARAPDGWPVVALRLDGARGRLWATEAAMQGMHFAPQADWGRSALLCFELRGGALLRRVEGPPSSLLGDMLVMGNGDVIVSDGAAGGVYRLREQGTSLERLDHGDFISPQTPAPHPDGRHLFVPDYVRGVAVLTLDSGEVHWLATDGRFALNGIDGLYFEGNRLIAVQNGTAPERVVAFTLNRTLEAIESQSVIERATATLGEPTHGVIAGRTFYYIANSGWDVLDERGQLKPQASFTPARIMQVELAALAAAAAH
jgi:hypothetical protein